MDLDEDWRSEYMIRDSYPGRVTYRSELPAPETRPSIHPSGLLQWQAGEFDREVMGVAGRELALRIHETVLSMGDI